MKKLTVLLLGVGLFVSSCATIQTKMGEVTMKFMTKKEKDFSKISAIGLYQTNMYSPETGITLGSKADWEEGSNLVGIQLLKPDGSVGFINFEGTITISGKEALGYGGGVYMTSFDESNPSPKTIRLENVDGVATEFNIQPTASVSIKSVNGKREDIAINLSEPIELELELGAEARNKRVRVALITRAVGVKGFAYFQSVPASNSITIDPAAFRHKHIAGGGPTGKDVTKWDVGENHLQVSIVEEDRDDLDQPFDYFKRASTHFDTVPVTLSGETEGRAYINVKGDVEAASGKFKYGASSSNAWYARPLNTNIKRIGIGSLTVEGVLFKQETESSESTSYYQDYKVITTTTTTTTFQFPQLEDRYWNQFLENIYADVVSILENTYGAQVVDVDNITSNPIYDEFFEPEDENTKKYISKSLRDTKRLFPATLGEVLSERSTSIIADASPMARLLRDLDLDALLSIAIDYRVAGDGDDKIVLLPMVSYQVTGQTQAFDGMANTWLQGSFEGPGVSFSRSEFSDLNALNRIGQKEILIDLFKTSLKELTDRQEEFGYQKVWDTALNN